MRLLAALGLLAALFATVTFLALESGEVAVLRTRAPDGGFAQTRVWVADADGAALIEAADSQRAWYQSLRMHPDVELLRDGAPLRYRATPEPGPEGRERIRALMREKYGWADWWVGMLQDNADSVLVRLEPLDQASVARRYVEPE